ncbi:MAG TPA: hypothetical protein VFQ23_15045 [Anaerolineales bacterium]|nr:hypothetical protein [Anaerolineales bacterium]
MEEILLLTVEHVVELSEDVLITPFLPVDKTGRWLHQIERVKIVKPDHQTAEKEAEFGIPFDADVYILLIPNTKQEEIPIGSQIWIARF